MILISSQSAQAVDALGSEEIEYSLVLLDGPYPRRCKQKETLCRKTSVLRLYNKFMDMRGDPYESYTISVSPDEVVIHRENKCAKWVVPLKGVLKNLSTPQIYYLFGAGTVIHSLKEVIHFMEEVNVDYDANYTCPVYFAGRNGYTIQL